jgi:hypothetical protein
MGEESREFQSACEHDDKVAEHARLIEVLGYSEERADEIVWGVFTPERIAELAAKEQSERERSANYATVANALRRTDYNELTRERLGELEDIQAEQRRKDMEF